jgi:hypothetical protein
VNPPFAPREWRNPILVVHPLQELVRGRVFEIAQGSPREEPPFKAICRGQDDVALASQPTLSRFENQAVIGGLEAGQACAGRALPSGAASREWKAGASDVTAGKRSSWGDP